MKIDDMKIELDRGNAIADLGLPNVEMRLLQTASATCDAEAVGGRCPKQDGWAESLGLPNPYVPPFREAVFRSTLVHVSSAGQ